MHLSVNTNVTRVLIHFGEGKKKKRKVMFIYAYLGGAQTEKRFSITVLMHCNVHKRTLLLKNAAKFNLQGRSYVIEYHSQVVKY